MRNNRQANIELARVIACLIVIGLHTVTWYTDKNGLLENSLLIRSFLTDGVPIYWYIMGYFLFANPKITLKTRLKKTFRNLLLPAFAVMIFSQIWQDWILADFKEVNFFSCLDMHSFDVHNLFGNILRWNADMTFGGHFWYIFSYVQVILWTPLLSFVCVNEYKANRCRHYLMALCALFIINRDLSSIAVLTIRDQTYPITVYSVITPTLLYILMGYETSLAKERIQKYASKVYIPALAAFIGFNLLKYAFSVHDMQVDISDSYFLGISTISGYMASYGLFLFCLCLKFVPNSMFEAIIISLGQKTLGIYLIHGLVYRKMKAIGIRSYIYMPYNQYPNNLVVELICTIVYSIIVFSVCLLLVCFMQQIRKTILKIWELAHVPIPAKEGKA